jgi:hypothetical protein
MQLLIKSTYLHTIRHPTMYPSKQHQGLSHTRWKKEAPTGQWESTYGLVSSATPRQLAVSFGIRYHLPWVSVARQKKTAMHWRGRTYFNYIKPNPLSIILAHPRKFHHQKHPGWKAGMSTRPTKNSDYMPCTTWRYAKESEGRNQQKIKESKEKKVMQFVFKGSWQVRGFRPV